MRRVIVHVNRLKLTGFPAQDRYDIAAGLEQELGRVFANREAISRLREARDTPRLRVGVHTTAQPMPQQVGERVGQSIGERLKR